MARIIALVLGLAGLLIAYTELRSEPKFFYGEDCEAENGAQSDVKGEVSGVFLSGEAGKKVAAQLTCAERVAAFAVYAKAFEAPVGTLFDWSAKAGSHGTFRITWDYENQGLHCRDFMRTDYVRKQRYIEQGAACRQSDRNWHFH